MSEFADVGAFWDHARVVAKLNPMQEYVGPSRRGTLPPETFSFGDSPELADALARLVVQGRKTATSGALAEYQAAGEPLPEPGQLSIVLDGAGAPRALIRTTEVRVVPFNEVDADHAAAEGEGDGTLIAWRRGHEDFFARTVGFSYTMPIVCERFELLYPSRWKPLWGDR